MHRFLNLVGDCYITFLMRTMLHMELIYSKYVSNLAKSVDCVAYWINVAWSENIPPIKEDPSFGIRQLDMT